MIHDSILSSIKARLLPSGPEQVVTTSVGGGSINEAFRIARGSVSFFCKINSAIKFPQLFMREKEALQAIAEHQIIKVPAVLDCFETGGSQVLVLEWVEEGQKTEQFWKLFGQQLAQLHHMSSTSFGWTQNNYMGSVPQSNLQDAEWPRFFREQRLHPLVAACTEQDLLEHRHRDAFDRMYHRLPEIFPLEPPALVHGDLWSGNFMCDRSGKPVLIDPAVYYGHRAVDLGMTTLFGGFHRLFYEAYHYHFPLPAGHARQWEICNLYPLLIHLFLFGKSYLRTIEQTLSRF